MSWNGGRLESNKNQKDENMTETRLDIWAPIMAQIEKLRADGYSPSRWFHPGDLENARKERKDFVVFYTNDAGHRVKIILPFSKI